MDTPELKEQRSYRESQKDLWDLFSVKETAENKGRRAGLEEGIVIGLEKGRAEGRAEGVLQVAKKLKAMGLPLESIAQSTGLSTEEVAKL